MKPPKLKKPKLSKEQLAQQMKMQEEAKIAKAFIREHFFPILQKGTKSLIHAEQTCEILKTVIMGKMQSHWAGMNLDGLKLIEGITEEEDVKDRDMYIELLQAFGSQEISTALKIIEGMTHALSGYTRKLAMDKPLADVAITEIINE